ncbi:MAG: UDP-N-acetylglucosamine 2-epimerase (non-hydrolyzing) [Bacteroidetes bacterium]|nr:UDP-N-acetylglucosamine 2-epimerase (non-hydrolyzing) [Bacteroidota bacterium]
MKKIAIVIGTRPEAIKLVPVFLELKKLSQVKTALISTGQHKEMLDQIFSFFQVKADFELLLMEPGQSLAKISSLLFTHLDDVYKNFEPDWVIVQGDTTTAMVAAITAFYKKIKVAHIEAGLRSYNKLAPFPEEVNRKIISQIADIHFAPTMKAVNNLLAENFNNVYQVGNTVIDALMMGLEKVNKTNDAYKQKYSSLFSNENNIILVTAHRRENFGHGLENICIALKLLASKHKELKFVFPVHLNPNIQEPVKRHLNNIPNITLLPPVSYDDMIFLLSRSLIILTDSGGIQEEAPALNVPFVVLREVTERPEGIEAGCGILGGTTSEHIISSFHKIYLNPLLLNKMKNAVNPYGDGQSSKKIISILQKKLT